MSKTLFRYPQKVPSSFRGGVATIGNFDGVHLGHKAVTSQLDTLAGIDKKKIVISFFPHPLTVVRKIPRIPVLTTIREKLIEVHNSSIDLLYLIRFTPKIAQLSASEFIERVFVDALGIEHLVIGEDAALGKNREGDLSFLRSYLPKVGIQLSVTPTFKTESTDGETRPSSRTIRELVQSGEIQKAAMLLGRRFSISSRVMHGDARGRTLGFPTANLVVRDRALPANGVYVCFLECDGVKYQAVTNIGVRPTFNGTERRVESHIINAPQSLDLYNKRVVLTFVEKLREEMKFNSLEDLKTQIAADIFAAEGILLSNV